MTGKDNRFENMLAAKLEGMEPMKRCGRCKVDKQLKEFNKNKKSKDGRHGYCRECYKLYSNTRNSMINNKSARTRREVITSPPSTPGEINKENLRRAAERLEMKPVSLESQLMDYERLDAIIEMVMREAIERERAEIAEEGKMCTSCGKVKPMDQFDVKTTGRKYRRCNECVNS